MRVPTSKEPYRCYSRRLFLVVRLEYGHRTRRVLIPRSPIAARSSFGRRRGVRECYRRVPQPLFSLHRSAIFAAFCAPFASPPGPVWLLRPFFRRIGASRAFAADRLSFRCVARRRARLHPKSRRVGGKGRRSAAPPHASPRRPRVISRRNFFHSSPAFLASPAIRPN